MSKRLLPIDYKSLAIERGFIWLGPEVPNGRTLTEWSCSQNHKWRASYGSIQQGRGCPECAKQSRGEKMRHSPADYKALAKERGFDWLGPAVPNANTKTEWACPEKHTWQTTFNNIQQKRGCPECAIQSNSEKLRLPPAAYKTLAKERGFSWLGPVVTNNNVPTEWSCPKKHNWKATYGKIQQGRGCPECAKQSRSEKRRLSSSAYKTLAKDRGFDWLGNKVPNTNIKTEWSCSENHKWRATYGSIQQGKGCPECAKQSRGEKRRLSSSVYKALAKERGFDWLGPEVPNVNTKTEWSCSENHKWKAAFAKVQQGRGCPKCAKQSSSKKQQHPSTAYKALAKERGFNWLGPEVPNANTKTEWACQKKHKWQARYSSIQHGSGCPECAKKKHYLLPTDYKSLAIERGFTWLGPEVPNGKTLTGWSCPKEHKWKATYYNIQHGSNCPDCVSKKHHLLPIDYKSLAIERGFIWLGPEVPNGRTLTEWSCPKEHKWKASYGSIQQGSGCLDCARQNSIKKRKLSSETYMTLAKGRGFTWLGPEVPNNSTPTEWSCPKNHKWKATYSNIRRGTSCPECAKQSRGEKRRLSSSVYKALAKERGFDWLGPEVPNNSTPTEWSCPKNHKWKAIYSSIQQGSGCPECANLNISKKLRLQPENYKMLAMDKSFRWLGPEVPNARAMTEWECQKNHRWHASFNNIQQGYGCPKCGKESSSEKLRLPPENYKKLAEQRDFQWLGPAVSNTSTPTEWSCSKGHIWQVGYGSIQSGSGCPKCAIVTIAEKQKIPPSGYIKLAKEQGITWLGPEAPNSNTRTKWKCPKEPDHEWMASYSSIQQGSGCPDCYEWKGEAELLKRIKSLLLGDEVLSRHSLPWLGQQHLDIWIPTHSVAFEYNGLQHYEPVDFFGGKEKFEKRKLLDERKRRLCKENGVRLKEVRYDYEISDDEILAFVNNHNPKVETDDS